MTITKKLYLMTGVALFLLMMIAGINLWSNKSGNDDLTQLVDQNVVPLMSIQQIDRDFLELRYRIIAVSTGLMPRSTAMGHLADVRQKTQKNWLSFTTAHSNSGRYNDEIKKIEEGLQISSRLFDKLQKLYENDDRKGMEAFLEDDWPVIITKITRPVAEMVALEGQAMQIARSNSQENASKRNNIAFAVLFLALAALLVQAVLLVKSIRRSIDSIQAVIAEVAKGNLAIRAPSEGKNEVCVMAAALNGALDAINAILNDVKRSSGGLMNSASEMMDTVSNAKHLLDEQNNHIIKVSAEMEELTVSIAEVSQRAGEIAQTATNARNVINDNEVIIDANRQAMQSALSSVEGTGAAVSELTDAIIKISAVTQVIKEVADQTNLLALNAAIEAARAGEQGRGFAVVADEVRKLAERTAASTTDITNTVELIKSKTSAASHSVNCVVHDVKKSAGQLDSIMASLTSILEATNNLTLLAQDIAAATAEQSTVAEQTANSMMKIAEMSEKNNNVVNEVTEHAEKNNKISAALKAGVARFNIA